MPRTIQALSESLPLAAPFRISRGVKTAAEVVTVSIGKDGALGRGEAVPYARYGETINSVLAQIASVTPNLAQGMERLDLLETLPAGAARNAIDCALWDLEARLSGHTVGQLIGRAEPGPLVTALTVSLDEPQAMGRAAAAYGEVQLLKVKVDAVQPEACLRAVRAAQPKARLIVDPNEGWTFDLLRDLQPALQALEVSLIEQPLPAEADHALAGFSPTIPICADESCHVAADLLGLVGRYQVVNIKLDKSGGLTEALILLEAARAQGFGIMVGCMVASSLGIAPAFHLAAEAAFVDLDGPIWLKQDRPGGVALHGGLLSPPRPGFWG